jgi:hypothetical protein
MKTDVLAGKHRRLPGDAGGFAGAAKKGAAK